MPIHHALLALLVVAIWGSNFVVIKWILVFFPPLLLTAIRFTLNALPLMFLIKCPPIDKRFIGLYGILIGVMQFGILYTALNGHISAGLASLVIQMQVFFTIAITHLRDRIGLSTRQIFSLLLGAAGLSIIAWYSPASNDVTLYGLALVLVAALCWALGNWIALMAIRPLTQKAKAKYSLGLVVWSSLPAGIVLMAISLFTEPFPSMTTLTSMPLLIWVGVFWQSYGNSLLGFSAWAYLTGRYATAQVSPWALLVPVFGIFSSVLFLGESFELWKLTALLLVLLGLILNNLRSFKRSH